MAEQRTLDTLIEKVHQDRRFNAFWWLCRAIRRSAPVTIYEQTLLEIVYQGCGLKHASYRFADDDLRRQLKCSRSELYATRKRLSVDSILRVGPLASNGYREYAVVVSNLVGFLPVEDQRHYYRLLDPHGGLDHCVESIPWTRSPPGGRGVHQVDFSAPHRNRKAIQEGTQKSIPPPPPLESASPSATPTPTWEAATAAVCAIGLCDWQTPIEAAKSHGVTPEYVLSVLDHFRASGSRYGLGALHRRLCRSHPGLDPTAGWAAPSGSPPQGKSRHATTPRDVAAWVWNELHRRAKKTGGRHIEAIEADFVAECKSRGIAEDIVAEVLGVSVST